MHGADGGLVCGNKATDKDAKHVKCVAESEVANTAHLCIEALPIMACLLLSLDAIVASDIRKDVQRVKQSPCRLFR